MPEDPHILYVMVQYFMSIFLEEEPYFLNIPLCVLTRGGFPVVFEDEVSGPPIRPFL